LETLDEIMRRKFERIYPYVFALLAAAIFWRAHFSFPTGRDILSASITMGAIFTGFLATLESMVVGLQNPKIENLRKTKFFNLLLSYLQEAIWMSLLYCGWNLLGFFYDALNPPVWFGRAWVALSFATLLTFYRVSSILIALIRSM
jgi:hypothetical protein